MVQVKCISELKDTDGQPIVCQDDMVYLGSIVSADGRVGRELARRLGAANAQFRLLDRFWRHAAISRKRKVQILNATVVPKLMYCLSTACLNLSERRRLDGFYCKCLRKIWGIKPAFISRCSNQSVLAATQQKPLTRALAKQQLILFGKAARASNGSLQRDCAFIQGSLLSACDRYVRKTGRPRLEWVSYVRDMAVRIAGSTQRVEELTQCPRAWLQTINAAFA